MTELAIDIDENNKNELLCLLLQQHEQTVGLSNTIVPNGNSTTLLEAAGDGKLETVQWLLQNGASLQEKDDNGSTALLVAAANGQLQTVQWLLQNGASLQEKDKEGDTALHCAALNGKLETVQWLTK